MDEEYYKDLTTFMKLNVNDYDQLLKSRNSLFVSSKTYKQLHDFETKRFRPDIPRLIERKTLFNNTPQENSPGGDHYFRRY